MLQWYITPRACLKTSNYIYYNTTVVTVWQVEHRNIFQIDTQDGDAVIEWRRSS